MKKITSIRDCLLASIAAISSFVVVSVRTSDLILHRFGWPFFLGGALGNGLTTLTDSSENTLETVLRSDKPDCCWDVNKSPRRKFRD
ncbi:unnamed protein product [Acanthoscelides obtectus]|uniref:Uncharacterized protein n=1 Tax=Acanthoscelides obtectus TaxID=200917 RepID=A0A9P0PM54_ACAOB|nr:unnamed protein product [Acanthoscelides obtectus]CAK1626116.1 hypothetical protein AOBTE_LOCUS3622 [Acanthoscelides obtectus]